MPVVPVLRVPQAVLDAPTLLETDFGDALTQVVVDLVDTMNASQGCVGLAAPQIGSDRRVAVIDLRRHRKPIDNHGLLVLVNPTITERSDPSTAREGCMSVPDFTGDVTRATDLVIDWQDESGGRCSDRFTGFEARAVQHEVDHLDGLLFLDRVAGREAVFRRKVYK